MKSSILHAARGPISTEALAETLEVSKRTIDRDVAALQAKRIPTEGEAAVGYVMRRGYVLPPLYFDLEEIEALRVGLMMLRRTGDGSLKRAASRIIQKIYVLQAEDPRLHVSPWGAPLDDPATGCDVLEEDFRDQAAVLHALWSE
ncbi:helix-turn-helix transcriptional regulator [Boseongicola aestuarii]|uniref:helix-turn-helix transcriptional regulator n=1 Tax=Boseongicola aestuarii TaxID=1470561 RepID=UPI001FEC6282|nr:HTH domain-containing protein [Boseongicola aestuarii]